MRIYQSLSDVVHRLNGSAIAIGNFDGVHLGHQALFDEARKSGRSAAAN